MTINILAVTLATIAQFVVGALWYSVLFGKLWGRIHGFDKLSKETQKEMMSKMGPFYGLQLLVTIVSAVVLNKLVLILPNYSIFTLTLLIWLGFIIPAQVSAVIFGGTEPKWIAKKILVMAAGALACLLVGAAVIYAVL